MCPFRGFTQPLGVRTCIPSSELSQNFTKLKITFLSKFRNKVTFLILTYGLTFLLTLSLYYSRKHVV